MTGSCHGPLGRGRRTWRSRRLPLSVRSIVVLAILPVEIASASSLHAQVYPAVEVGVRSVEGTARFVLALHAEAAAGWVDPNTANGAEASGFVQLRIRARSSPALVVGARVGYLRASWMLDCVGFAPAFALEAEAARSLATDGNDWLVGGHLAAANLGTLQLDRALGGSTDALVGIRFPMLPGCHRD